MTRTRALKLFAVVGACALLGVLPLAASGAASQEDAHFAFSTWTWGGQVVTPRNDRLVEVEWYGMTIDYGDISPWFQQSDYTPKLVLVWNTEKREGKLRGTLVIDRYDDTVRWEGSLSGRVSDVHASGRIRLRETFTGVTMTGTWAASTVDRTMTTGVDPIDGEVLHVAVNGTVHVR